MIYMIMFCLASKGCVLGPTYFKTLEGCQEIASEANTSQFILAPMAFCVRVK